MDKLCKKELCTGCTACAGICPNGCITMLPDEEGFLRPLIDEDICIDCGLCRKICSVLQESVPAERETVAYAAINRNEGVRNSSTSGGIFTLLSQWVLDQGGVVFGAAYNENFEVVHCQAETANELARFRGAKYTQSRLNDTFKQIDVYLKEDRYVLFSGTPCQVGGLLAFVGKPYDKLILVDLVCHGVPSPKVWEHYIRFRSQQDALGENPTYINLRSKEIGWPGYSIRFEYPDGKIYSAPNSQDPYLRGFVGNLYLRPSCYDCQFKGVTRQSDFTLADYWGVWNQLPEYHDGKGTSLVLLHTQKAKQLWNEISANVCYSEVDAFFALAENPSATVSCIMQGKRAEFFEYYKTNDFQMLVEKLMPRNPATTQQSIFKRLLRRVEHITKRILSMR